MKNYNKKIVFVVMTVVLSLLICGLAYAGTKTAGPWTTTQYVNWDDVNYAVVWSYDYKGEYTDSGTLRTVNNHFSGDCKSNLPFPYTIANSLHYFKNGTRVKQVYFDTNLSAMCSYPKHPYQKAKYNDPVTYSITGDLFRTDVLSTYSSDVTDPSYAFRSQSVN